MKLPLAVMLLLAFASDTVRPGILRPTDGAALEEGKLSVIAAAQGGRLELDRVAVRLEEPAPGVLHGIVEVSPGEHTLALIWPGGRREARFFVGRDAPAPFVPYRQHPSSAIECSRCHEAGGEARWRFKGGCFDCHDRDEFPRSHSHTADEIPGCGSCHDPHGSTVAALLLAPRTKVCGQCHSPR
jgi:predicted CXXCH cytochrome family protein